MSACPSRELLDEVAMEGGAPRRRWIVASALAAAVVAAGAYVTAQSAGRAGEDPETTASATAAIDRAEAEYRQAIEVLEKQVSARAAAHHHGTAIARARSGLAWARAASGKDVAGRVRLLEGYAAYLKSLRRALREAQ